MSSFKVRSTADVNPIALRGTGVKAAALELNGYQLTNRAASIRYLKLWDAANAADITVGTTPPDMVIILPATSTTVTGNLAAMFTKGIVICTTTGALDSDVAAPTAGDVVGFLNYDLPGR